MADKLAATFHGASLTDTVEEAIARGRWTPKCGCGEKATHACSYCRGVCDTCIDHCEQFGHVWVVMS